MQSKILKFAYRSAAALIVGSALGGCVTYSCEKDTACRDARERHEFMSATLPMLFDQKTGKIDPDTALLTISYLNQSGNKKERGAIDAVVQAKGYTMADVAAAAKVAAAMQSAAQNAKKGCIIMGTDGRATVVLGVSCKGTAGPAPAR